MLAQAILTLAIALLPGSPSPQNASGQDAGALGAIAHPPESWEGVAWRLATSLVDPQARALEEPLFLPRAMVHQFGQAQAQSPMALRDRYDGWRVLCVTAFSYPEPQMVADTATALARLRQQEGDAVPEAVVRAMTPAPEAMGAAEQTATRWMTVALGPARGDKVGLLLLWNTKANDRPMLERLALVMIKAGRLPDGRYRVQAGSYGTAQQAILDGL